MSTEQRLTIQLVQGCHGDPEDFNKLVQKSEQALLQAQVIGIEISWRPLNKQVELSSLEYIFADYPGRQSFQKAQLLWLNEHNKIILPCEYPTEYQSELSDCVTQLTQLCWRETQAQNNRTATILYGAYQTIRQWIFLAQLGYWLHHLETKKLITNEPLTVPIMTGTHRALETKLKNCYSIPTERYFVPNDDLGQGGLDENYYDLFEAMTTHARVTQTQLKNPLSLS